jgi:hypothetical protein
VTVGQKVLFVIQHFNPVAVGSFITTMNGSAENPGMFAKYGGFFSFF